LGWRTITLSDHPFDVSRAWFPDLEDVDDLLERTSTATGLIAAATQDTPPAPIA
jgi:hypothetical protein